MRCGWVAASLAGAMIAMPCASWAQQQPMRQAQAPKVKPKTQPQPADPNLDVEELTPSQIKRAQVPEPSPAAKGAAKAAPKEVAKEAAKPSAAAAARVVTCSGLFAKDSSHVKLAMVYNTSNVVFTEVDGPENSKLMATVLFPKDPKRRLEVWWLNEAARSGTYLIVINGHSTWSAPKGLKLGLQVAALEKLNGKPFKLKGFDKDNSSTITDWDGGVLGQLPGGCKAGVRLTSDAKAPQEARDAVADAGDFVSTDAKVRAVKPAVAEIILGY
jgi:hypothetical protein